MAYITCKRCGCQMSDKSEACPVCGASVVEDTTQKEDTNTASNDSHQKFTPSASKAKNKKKILWIATALTAVIAITTTTIIIVHNNKEKQAAEQLRIEQQMAELKEQKRIEEERQKAEKETENLISEIKRQILEALKKGTIHDLMTPDFKSAEKAAMEAQAKNGIYFDVDIFYHTQDELPDIIDVSEVNLINKDNAYVKVMYVFRNDWGNSIDNTTLFVIRDKQASNSKWLVDDIVELKEGIVSYSEKASMHEFAAEDSEWRQYVVIDGSGLRLRLEPSTDADTFKWPDGTNRHPKVGDKFTYLGEYGDFYKIDFNGNAWWVSKEYTHIETENQTSQNNDDEQNVYEEDEIYQKVDDMPSFPGGETKLMEYVGKNLKYPQEAREKGVQGRVFVGFVVEPDGSISDVKLLRGIGGGCDEEAIRVVKSFPKWKPGKHQGKFVRVSYMLPVNFKLA